MKTVLFVDDEESILKITKIFLATLNINVILANSGKKAIEILSDKAYETTIDIMFLDLTMSGMSGIEVLKWMRKESINLPVILQTGISDEQEIKKAKKLQIKDYLIKPYSQYDMQQMIMKYT